ncbi:hypothetical protein MOQ72_20325 [Saccharopolyspora sp. K220]|uniref:hypothetical protein n=1 Tax=Saccharopolyspora soli TaxID=2926618 RepID=UPI001F59B62A|nr:hypothetical protein [Saccharopolyspora soli]MCI2419797.1 hypothetical protein [Saccharopolyspora soli]
MTRQPRRRTKKNSDTGFTVILCDSCGNNGQLPILGALRDTIRRCPNAVLVRAHCPLGRLWCHVEITSTPRTGGHLVLVQRCTGTREPVGAVMPVGPVRTTEDLTALTRWLETTPVSIDELPRRLHWFHHHRRQATRN